MNIESEFNDVNYFNAIKKHVNSENYYQICQKLKPEIRIKFEQ